MLKIIENFMNLPESFDINDLDIEFQPGQIAALKIKNKEKLITICDGLYPIGIIDDIHSSKIRKTVWRKTLFHTLRPTDLQPYNKNSAILGEDLVFNLNRKGIIKSSFSSTVHGQFDQQFNENGTFTLFKGNAVNIERSDTIIVNVSYSYNENSKLESSVIGNNKISIWTKNSIIETDMFDTSTIYPKYANLFVNNGLFTTTRIFPESKCVGFVWASPSQEHPFIQVFFDLKNANIEFGGK